jgi:hypothetical protein
MTLTRSASRDDMPAKKRELLDTGTDKRYIRRDERGRFTKDQVDVGRSSATDQRQRSSGTSKPGQGNTGDRKK